MWYRENVSHHNPEGSSWSLVDTPGEAVQISCGPHDLLWVTLWEGQALVREGINRNNPKGGRLYALRWERRAGGAWLQPPTPTLGQHSRGQEAVTSWITGKL